MLQGCGTSKAGILGEMGEWRGGSSLGVKKANHTSSDFGTVRDASGTKVHFPPEIAITTLRLNLGVWSKSRRMSSK